MIRMVAVGRVRPGVTKEQIEEALQALRQLRVKGLNHTMASGIDLGLREGNASFAITADIKGEEGISDEDAYRLWDRDSEHWRIRAKYFRPILIDGLAHKVQFSIPD
ncbi:hypothetical protein [Paraburkholderia sp. JHI869]|uniref:hypothetical protein n=1 Tax=Paraburkholderia sp. JHI869 TaxID=3112959 RepID=UPI003180EE9C